MMMKNEENPRRRSISCVAADGEAQATRSVKRRRRDPTAVNARISVDTQSQPQQQFPQQQVDQTSPASTVKRSSKFRGVSRSEQGNK
jgi:hypothetical protein